MRVASAFQCSRSKGWGSLPEQVVADEEGPDQVVRPQHVEGGEHGLGFQVALLAHHLVEVVELLLVDEHGEVAGLGEVHLGREHGRRLEALVADAGQVAERHADQRAADAVAEAVHLVLAGGGLDGIQRRDDALGQVVVEFLVGQRLVRVHPGDDEHRVAPGHGPAHQRLLRRQVQDVVLVDPRRHHEDRRAVHLLGRRLVLDQLDQVVLEHHLARRRGQVPPQLEGVRVAHGDLQLAVAPLEVPLEVTRGPCAGSAPGSRRWRAALPGSSRRSCWARRRRRTGGCRSPPSSPSGDRGPRQRRHGLHEPA